MRLYVRLRFGVIREEVKSVDGGCVSEYACYGRRSRMVGYWAYGGFDPSFPYHGQDLT